MAIDSSDSLQYRANMVFDVRELDGLRGAVQRTPESRAAQQQVAQQFESLFLNILLKRMREATPREGLFDSDQTRLLESMRDEQLAMDLSNPGIGLAQAILQQMQQGMGSGLPAAALGQASRQTDGDDDFLSALPVHDGNDRHLRTWEAEVQSPGVANLLDVMTQQDPQLAAQTRTPRAAGVQRQQAVSEALAAGAPQHVVDFVARMAPQARNIAEDSGVPARLMLAQAALESGWGQREIRHADGRSSHNLFGIKATGNWKGKVVHVMTTEYQDGVAQKVMQPFRAYDSYEESFADYARLISRSPRYQAVMDATNEHQAARAVQAAGYATDPRYADKLIRVMAQMGPH